MQERRAEKSELQLLHWLIAIDKEATPHLNSVCKFLGASLRRLQSLVHHFVVLQVANIHQTIFFD